jgi:hypothetical protein
MTDSLFVDTESLPDTLATPAPRMRLAGSTWLDEAGVPLAKPLRGWNWGHWGQVVATDARDHVTEGATCVRIPLRWFGFYAGTNLDSYDPNAPGFIDPAHLAQLDQYIAWCSSVGLKIILTLDSNCGQNGSQGMPDDTTTFNYCTYPVPNTVGGTGGQNFYNNAAFRARFWALWAFIAKRYRHVPNIAILEVSPEQAPPGFPASAVHDFYVEGFSVIRKADPDTIIMVGGPNAYAIAKTRSVYDTTFVNVAFTGNELGATVANTDTLPTKFGGLTSLRDDYGVGIFVQQIGCESSRDPGNTLLPAALDMLVAADVGFTVWEYRSPQADSFGPFPTPGSSWTPKTNVLASIVSRFQA